MLPTPYLGWEINASKSQQIVISVSEFCHPPSMAMLLQTLFWKLYRWLWNPWWSGNFMKLQKGVQNLTFCSGKLLAILENSICETTDLDWIIELEIVRWHLIDGICRKQGIQGWSHNHNGTRSLAYLWKLKSWFLCSSSKTRRAFFLLKCLVGGLLLVAPATST